VKRSSGTARDYPRTARLNHLLHEIVAEEIERLDDERLGLFTVVAVEVDPDLRHATVWYTALGADGGGVDGEPGAGAALAEALAEHRARLQRAIGRQARIKRTPELSFRPDAVIQRAERVERILRGLGEDPPAGPTGQSGGESGADPR
jgi:ribosome-binding factor A